MISHYDSTFIVWNTLISLKGQGQCSNDLERDSSDDESNQACFIVQENDSLEINLESNLDDCTSTSNDNMSNENVHMLNEGLSMFCEDSLRKYKLLKNKSLNLNKGNEFLSSKLNCVLKEKKFF